MTKMLSRLFFRRSSTVEVFDLMNLPEDIIIYILSFVPPKDLLRSCVLVSKLFKQLIDCHSLWKIKCVRYKRRIPSSFVFDTLPSHYYRTIYVLNPYGRNLLKNTHGMSRRDPFEHWVIDENHGDGWIVEPTPAGADPIPQTNSSHHSCFATSYGNCSKYQIINLKKEGLHEKVLDDIRPHIKVSEWYAARFDCGSIYKLRVALLDKDGKELDFFLSGEKFTEQWVGRQWNKVKHVFSNYPKGVRFVKFWHFGIDTQFWAGHFGSKMTGGVVKILDKPSLEKSSQ